MFKLLCALALVVCVVAKMQIMVHDCGSVDSKINSITVDQCDHEPCHVHRGEHYTIHVNFTTDHPVKEAHNHLHASLGFFRVPFPLRPENACGVNVKCPMAGHTTYIYSNTMICPSYAPNLRVTAIWEVKDEHQNDLFCFTTVLKIVS